jgi:DNA-binding transcriptional LysR family regulator
MGISLISESFARQESQAGDLVLIPLSDANLSRELALVYHQDRTLPRSAVAFIEMVRNGVQVLKSPDTADADDPELIDDESFEATYLGT